MARVAKDRSKTKAAARAKRAYDQSSSDGGEFLGSSDMEMDDDDEDDGKDEVDDPVSPLTAFLPSPKMLKGMGQLFQRFMAAEMRRNEHRQRYLFEHQVGSSFDPDMEDMADWEADPESQGPFTIPHLSPYCRPKEVHSLAPDDVPDDLYYDEEEEDDDFFDEEAIRAELEADLEALEQKQNQQQQYHLSSPSAPSSQPTVMQTSSTPTGSQNTPSPTAAPAPNPIDFRNAFLNHLLHSSCPQCHRPALRVSPELADAVACDECRTTFPLNSAANSWVEDHPTPNE